MFNGLMI